MEIPSKNTPVAKCLALATFACQMMSKMAATQVVLQELVVKLNAARDKLATAENAYSAAETNLLPARVAVRFADHESDEGIKQRKRAAEMADGEANGPLASHLFPNGTTPLTKPLGAAQTKEMRDLEGRYDALISTWPDAATEKQQLTFLRQRYELALTTRSSGEQALADAKAARDFAKEEFLDAYAEVANRIRALFPRNKQKQDLFFDRVMQRVPTENEVPEAATP
jgi:hypothetical protein